MISSCCPLNELKPKCFSAESAIQMKYTYFFFLLPLCTKLYVCFVLFKILWAHLKRIFKNGTLKSLKRTACSKCIAAVHWRIFPGKLSKIHASKGRPDRYRYWGKCPILVKNCGHSIPTGTRPFYACCRRNSRRPGYCTNPETRLCLSKAEILPRSKFWCRWSAEWEPSDRHGWQPGILPGKIGRLCTCSPGSTWSLPNDPAPTASTTGADGSGDAPAVCLLQLKRIFASRFCTLSSRGSLGKNCTYGFLISWITPFAPEFCLNNPSRTRYLKFHATGWEQQLFRPNRKTARYYYRRRRTTDGGKEQPF